jgi:HrpA-like RNA helicase
MKVTPLGETMSKLSLDPCLSRAIIEAVELKCIKEVRLLVESTRESDERTINLICDSAVDHI